MCVSRALIVAMAKGMLLTLTPWVTAAQRLASAYGYTDDDLSLASAVDAARSDKIFDHGPGRIVPENFPQHFCAVQHDCNELSGGLQRGVLSESLLLAIDRLQFLANAFLRRRHPSTAHVIDEQVHQLFYEHGACGFPRFCISWELLSKPFTLKKS